MDSKRLRELAGLPAGAITYSGVLLEVMQKPKPGQAFGANDQGPPEDYTEDQLSRLADILYMAGQIEDGLSQAAFKGLPANLQGEFNYAKWQYVAPKL